jgi:hypothetical protein
MMNREACEAQIWARSFRLWRLGKSLHVFDPQEWIEREIYFLFVFSTPPRAKMADEDEREEQEDQVREVENDE